MKRLNKKGFTLIELLAVIIILGVLLLIAVPSVSKYIIDSRMKTYNTNLSNFVSAVANEVNAMDYNSDYNFKSTEILLVPFKNIEIERGDNTKSPFAQYTEKYSFVLVVRKYDDKGTPLGFEYYVQAYDDNGYGANIAKPTDVKVQALAAEGLVEIPGFGGSEATELELPSSITIPSQVETVRIVGLTEKTATGPNVTK